MNDGSVTLEILRSKLEMFEDRIENINLYIDKNRTEIETESFADDPDTDQIEECEAEIQELIEERKNCREKISELHESCDAIKLFYSSKQRFVVKFVEFFNRKFGSPFLPEGFAAAELRKNIIHIRIGKREMDMNMDGESMGAGTSVTSKWKIVERIEGL